MADKKHLNILSKGVETWNKWRQENPEIIPKLDSAHLMNMDLRGCNLKGAHLRLAHLMRSNLEDADLSGADLFKADLMAVTLVGAKLYWADLVRADFAFADMRRADLREARIVGTLLNQADLRSSNLERAFFDETVLVNVDLTGALGLELCVHEGPSTIDYRTILKSGPLPAKFLLGCGLPQELIDCLQRIGSELRHYTCFIAYGEPDLKFAQKLYEDLKRAQVSCWLYDTDAKVGERTWKEITLKRRGADKMVVLCSAQALLRDGMLKEIEEQIDEDPDKLVPISLDDLWKQPGFKVFRGTRDLRPSLIDRNYADFANLPYEKAFERLLKGLERPRVSADL